MKLFLLLIVLTSYLLLSTANLKKSSSILSHSNSNSSTSKKKQIETTSILANKQIQVSKTVSSDVKPIFDDKLKGYLTIIGGLLTHLTLGSLYCWGNFGSYAPKHLKFFDGNDYPGKQPDSSFVLPLTLVAQCLALPFGSIITGKIGSRATMLLGSSILALGVFLSSFATTLPMFILFYSIMVGTGIGIAYTAPMIAGWKYMPSSKGFVSGAILTGFGAGGFFFNLIGSKIVNPNGLNPVNGVFAKEIYDNFPLMLKKLSAIYIAVAATGAMLVTEPKSVTANKSTTTTATAVGISVTEALKTFQFWQIWAMIICSASAGLNVAAIYKQFASTAPALSGDGFQSLVGGMGALFNGVGRLFWGSFSDKVGFKAAFMLLTSLQAILHIVYPYSSSSKHLFLISTCSSFFLLAGNFALIPPATQRIFGAKNGALIYGLVYSAFGVASVGSLVLSKTLISKLGWLGIFRVMGTVSLAATILSANLKPLKQLPSSTV